jgi:hypothetical protein
MYITTGSPTLEKSHLFHSMEIVWKFEFLDNFHTIQNTMCYWNKEILVLTEGGKPKNPD